MQRQLNDYMARRRRQTRSAGRADQLLVRWRQANDRINSHSSATIGLPLRWHWVKARGRCPRIRQVDEALDQKPWDKSRTQLLSRHPHVAGWQAQVGGVVLQRVPPLPSRWPVAPAERVAMTAPGPLARAVAPPRRWPWRCAGQLRSLETLGGDADAAAATPVGMDHATATPAAAGQFD